MTLTELLIDNEKSEEFKKCNAVGFFTPSLFMNISYPKKDEGYHLQASVSGPGSLPKKDAIERMIYFLEKYPPQEVNWSTLSLKLNDGQNMSLVQNRVQELGQNLFRINLRALDSKLNDENYEGLRTESMPILADILKGIYGLEVGRNPYTKDYKTNPFDKMKDPRTGINVETAQGLKYGTVPQRKAFEAIDRIKGQLSESELDNLRRNYPELTKAFPATRQLKSTLIQVGEQATPDRFAGLLKNLPKEVDSVDMLVHGNGTLTLSSRNEHLGREPESPDISIILPPGGKEQIFVAVEDLWRVHQELNKDSSLDKIAAAIKKG